MSYLTHATTASEIELGDFFLCRNLDNDVVRVREITTEENGDRSFNGDYLYEKDGDVDKLVPLPEPVVWNTKPPTEKDFPLYAADYGDKGWLLIESTNPGDILDYDLWLAISALPEIPYDPPSITPIEKLDQAIAQTQKQRAYKSDDWSIYVLNGKIEGLKMAKKLLSP